MYSAHNEQLIKLLFAAHPRDTGIQIQFITDKEGLLMARLKGEGKHSPTDMRLAEIENKAFRGAEFLYTLKLPSGQRTLSLVSSHHNHAIGKKIGIKLAVDHVVAFRRE